MIPSYATDVVPTLTTIFGGDTVARDLAGLVARFTGYLITDREYAKFRAQVMILVHEHMGVGFGGVDLIAGHLHSSFEYNETHALWLIDDLEKWGFSVRAWFVEDGDENCFMSVRWGFSNLNEDRTHAIQLFETATNDLMDTV